MRSPERTRSFHLLNLQKTVNPGDKQAITALRFMPQGNELIVVRTNGEIELWQSDGTTKKIVARNTSKNIKENLTSLAISSDYSEDANG